MSLIKKSLLTLFLFVVFITVLSTHSLGQSTEWIRPAKPGDPLTWGRRDGIVFGLSSEGGMKGPRGLIRVGIYADGAPQLLNYIAVEPVIEGPSDRVDRMAFSELEMSQLDPGQRGKRMWVGSRSIESTPPFAGSLVTLHLGDTTLERLSVEIDVEPFTANGAHVHVVASIDSDRPLELRLSTFAETDSAPIEELTLTATMGNYERLRQLWLRDRVISSRTLFGPYKGDDFAEGVKYQLGDMIRNNEADAIVYCTSDEASPRETPGNRTAHWPYTLPKLTQYWLVPGHDVQPDLRVRVNARRVYWASHAPVLGGIAFENFEVRQRYVPGQTFVYGISSQPPWILDKRLAHLQPAKRDNAR